MASKEALKSICDECQIEKGKNKTACPFRSLSNDYCDEYEIIKKDLLILEAIKNSLIIERMPPKSIDLNKIFNINDYVDYVVKYNNYKLDKEIQEKLTKWIIENIDKKIVRKWIEDE